jgi:hypothetical protein
MTAVGRMLVGAALALACAAPAGAQGGVKNMLWTDPGNVATLDLAAGPGGTEGAPKPPFTFVEESRGGSNPKVKVRDAAGVEWVVKFGREVRSDVFAARIAWAAGYFVEPSYFVPSGRIEGAARLSRARKFVRPDGSFVDARFERRARAMRFEDERSWAWHENPFAGTRELAGLKVVVMLLSNWDNKDARDHRQNGSNTVIWETVLPDGTTERRFVVGDWGGTMGRWGRPNERWTTWDCEGFAAQSDELVRVGPDGRLAWGFRGQRTSDMAAGVSAAEVRWIMQYLGALTDDQIRAALVASGASAEEADCFTAAMRRRLDALARVQEVGAESELRPE